MSLDNFTPVLWAARLLANLNDRHVYANLANREYEGEINGAGDSVKITGLGRVTVGDYTKDTDIGSPETLTTAQTTLNIDQQKYFNFQVDDIDKAQNKPKVMEEAMREAAWALNDTVDAAMAALYSEIPSANFASGSTYAAPVASGALTAGSSFYDYVVDLQVILDKSNTPEVGRWVVVPPWARGVMQKDSRFINATQLGNDIRARGVIAQAAGFDIYVSNNVVASATTSAGAYVVMAGYPGAWAYAEQVASVEAYRPEKRFADAVKGLLVYGYKVVRPSNLAVLYAKYATS